MHSGTNPVTFIRFTECLDSNKVCLIGENYAWVDAEKQFYSYGSSPDNSQVYLKNLLGYCRDPQDFRQELLPGRNCSYDTQCMSGNCNSAGVCAGKAINEPCSDNNECDVNLACVQSTRTFPWQTICKRLLFEGDECDNDFQCGYDMVCSYATSANVISGMKQCIKKYSLNDDTVTGYTVSEGDTLKDMAWNGMKCKSGLCRQTKATECKCFSIANVTTDKGPQNNTSTLVCTAMSQYNYCQYFYLHDDDGDRIPNLGYLKLDCQCSLDGSAGYCPLPSQSQVNAYVNIMKQVDSYAAGCHTNDRYNIQAQMECGIGKQYVNIQDIYSLLETKFKFEYYPFTQYLTQPGTLSPCMNQGHPDSPYNLIRLTQLLRDRYTSQRS